MSQQAIVQQTTQEAIVTISQNFRMHTIGLKVFSGVVRIDVMPPGGDYEPVMDSATNAPIEVAESEVIVFDELAIQYIKFKPDSASYSAIVTSQASD